MVEEHEEKQDPCTNEIKERDGQVNYGGPRDGFVVLGVLIYIIPKTHYNFYLHLTKHYLSVFIYIYIEREREVAMLKT